MNKPKPFAKLFCHPTLGQLLVQRSCNDEDKPGVQITFDTGIEQLQSSHVFLAVGGVDDETANKAADQLFENFDEDMAVASTEKQIELIHQMFANQH